MIQATSQYDSDVYINVCVVFFLISKQMFRLFSNNFNMFLTLKLLSGFFFFFQAPKTEHYSLYFNTFLNSIYPLNPRLITPRYKQVETGI